MTIQEIRFILGWCTVINMGILSVWFLLFVFGHDWIYGLHSKWFNISVEKYDSINYTLMGFFKLSTLLFNAVPYLAFVLLI